MGPRRAGVLIGVLALIRVVILAVTVHTPAASRAGHVLVADVQRMREVGPADTLAPAGVEYPPLAVAITQATARHGDLRATVVRVGSVMLAADLVAAAVLAWGFGAPAGLLYLLFGLPLTPFVYFRLDLVAVAAVAGAWALVHRRRPIAAGVLIAAAVFVKLWPVVLVPVLFVGGRRRAAMVAAAATAAGTAAWLVAAGPARVLDVVTFRHARGLHIESGAGALWRFAHHGVVRFEAGAQRTPPVPDAVRFLLGAAFVVLCGVILRRAAAPTFRSPARSDRGDGADRRSVVALAVVAALIACSPLFSPQYVTWLLPFAAVAASRDRDRLLEGSVLVLAALSMLVVVEFGAVRTGRIGAEALVLVRNAALVALAFVAARRIEPGAATMKA